MNIAIRDAYGDALVKLGHADPRVAVLEADVGSSTRSILFGQAFPERYFNLGIAEFNMATVAAGLASNGLIPIVNTFATFMVTRCADTINNLICHDRLNVKLCGAYAGVSDSYDGASHHCLFDIAFMRSMPGMMILSPCDAVETFKALFAAARHDGPVYLRLSRAAVPVITSEDTPFEAGKGILLRPGRNVTLIATGSVVCRALQAAESLAAIGIDAQVIDMHTIQPLDQQLIADCLRLTGRAVTIEEHSVTDGLGTAVAEAMMACGISAPLLKLGIESPTESGGYEELIARHHLDAPSIASTVSHWVTQGRR